jgi:hypothetical protein
VYYNSSAVPEIPCNTVRYRKVRAKHS